MKHLKRFIIFCILFVLFSCGILLYSHYIGTKGFNVREYGIQYKDISDSIYGLKIVQISDIHYGRTVHLEELEKLVKKINLTKPDIVVFTGDLIDKDTTITNEEEEKIAEILKKIDVNIGKYAIKGEQDLNYSNWDIVIENSDFIDLNDKYQTIYFNSNDYLLLAGVSSNNNGNIEEKIKETLSFIETSSIKPNYSILLLHEPDFVDKIDYSKFQLILAGHSHNGQVRLPFIGAIIKPKYSKKYYDEHYSINSSQLYISGGIGVSEFNFRLFNHPSFNLYRLIR